MKQGVEPDKMPATYREVVALAKERRWDIREVVRRNGELRVNVVTHRKRSPTLTFVVPH